MTQGFPPLPPIPGLAQPQHPGVLALVGSGEYLPPMDSVDRELLERAPSAPIVVCLPTAAGTEGDVRVRYWMDLGVAHFQRLGVPVHAIPVIDRTSASEEQYAAAIDLANFVYLSGGKPGYLFNTLQGTLVWAAIERLLGRGGVVAGCSAGAMIMGERLASFPVPGIGQEGFGFLPGTVVIPHFDELPGAFIYPIKKVLGSKYTLIGVDANTALVSSKGQFQALGTRRVAFFNALAEQDFRA